MPPPTWASPDPTRGIWTDHAIDSSTLLLRESSSPFHRPGAAAARARAAADAGHQPAVELAPADAGPVRHARPRSLGAGGPRSGAAAGGDPHGQARRAGRRRRDRRDHPRARRRPRRVPRRAALVPGRAGGRPDAARGDRLLLDGVRRLRGAAQLLGRPRRARGRPPQGVLGPRPAAHRGGAAVPVGVLPAVAVARRLAAGDLPGARPAGAAAAAARSTHERASRCSSRSRCPPGSC